MPVARSWRSAVQCSGGFTALSQPGREFIANRVAPTLTGICTDVRNVMMPVSDRTPMATVVPDLDAFADWFPTVRSAAGVAPKLAAHNA